MKLKFYYSAGGYRFSERQTQSSGIQIFRKFGGLPLIFHFPNHTDFRELRIDFETGNNTVKLSKIEVKDGFSLWTIPGKLIPKILRTQNDIADISVEKGDAVFKIGNKSDAYIIFDRVKFQNSIKPRNDYPWLDFLMFPIAELFMILVLYMCLGPKTEENSLSILRIGMIFLKIYIFLVLLFLLLRITGALLPRTPRLYNNMQQNILMANHEGLYHPINGVLMNNFTDIAEFSHGYYLQPETPLFSSLQSRRSNVADLPKKWNTNIIIGSRLYTEGLFQNQLGLIRYWVGSSSVWRLLSEFITYKEIRTFFSFIFLGLCAVMLCLAWQRTGLYSSVCLALMLSTSAISLLFISTSFYWSFLGMLVLSSYILHKEKIQLIEYASAFFITGAFVVYLELFTNPMLSLVVPGILAMLRIYQDDPNLNWKKAAGCFFTLSISWFGGYALIWGTKWLIASLVFPSAIAQILNAIRYRSSTLDVKSKQISRLAGLFTNSNEFFRLNSGLIALSAVLLLIVTVIMVMTLRKHKIKYPFPLACATAGFALIPIGWQIVTANHAIIHFWMTYKVLSGTLFGLLILPGLPFLNIDRKVLHEDLKSFCRKIRFSEFGFYAAASLVLLVAAVVLTGIFNNRCLPYRSYVILDTKIPCQIILRNKNLCLETDTKSKNTIISAPVSDQWTRCSWEIRSPQTGQIKMKIGCKPIWTRYGKQRYTVEYKQIVIDGKLHPNRLHHFSDYSFREISLTVQKDKPVNVSCLVRLHPNWGNENQR